jgi:hypothetical protein
LVSNAHTCSIDARFAWTTSRTAPAWMMRSPAAANCSLLYVLAGWLVNAYKPCTASMPQSACGPAAAAVRSESQQQLLCRGLLPRQGCWLDVLESCGQGVLHAGHCVQGAPESDTDSLLKAAALHAVCCVLCKCHVQCTPMCSCCVLLLSTVWSCVLCVVCHVLLCAAVCCVLCAPVCCVLFAACSCIQCWQHDLRSLETGISVLGEHAGCAFSSEGG